MCQAMQKYSYCTLNTKYAQTSLIYLYFYRFIYKDIYLQHIHTNMIMAKVTSKEPPSLSTVLREKGRWNRLQPRFLVLHEMQWLRKKTKHSTTLNRDSTTDNDTRRPNPNKDVRTVVTWSTASSSNSTRLVNVPSEWKLFLFLFLFLRSRHVVLVGLWWFQLSKKQNMLAYNGDHPHLMCFFFLPSHVKTTTMSGPRRHLAEQCDDDNLLNSTGSGLTEFLVSIWGICAHVRSSYDLKKMFLNLSADKKHHQFLLIPTRKCHLWIRSMRPICRIWLPKENGSKNKVLNGMSENKI